MRIRVDLATDSAVRVIRDLTVGRVSLLEGHNGIGKSSLLRLLQIATGSAAFSDSPRSWDSFRTGVGVGSLTVDGLRDGRTIQWRFDSADWPADPRAKVSMQWFTSIEIDGVASDIKTVRDVLRVTRISGDTGIVETFAEELLVVRDQLIARLEYEDALMRDPDSVSGRALHLLENALQLTDSLSREALEFREEAAEEAREVALAVAGESLRLVRRRDELREALSISRQLDELDSVGPHLDQELQQIEADIARNEKRLGEIRSAIDDAIAASAAGEALRNELKRAETNLRRNQRQLEAAAESIATALAIAEIDDVSGVKARAAVMHAEFQHWITELSKADQTPAAVELARRIEVELRRSATLLDHEILPSSYTPNPTVLALADALREKRVELSASPGSPDFLDLRTKIDKRRRELDRINAIPSLLADREGAERRAAEYQARVDELTANEELAQEDTLEGLRQEDRGLSTEHTDLVGRRAQLRQMRGMLLNAGDAAARRQLFQRLVTDLEVDPGDVAVALEAATIAAQEASDAALQADLDATNAEQALASTHASLRAAIDALDRGSSFEWLRGSPVGWAEEPRSDAATAAESVQDLNGRLRNALDRVVSLPNELSAMRAALDAIVSELRDPTTEVAAGRRYYQEVKDWAAKHFGSYFDRDSIRSALLDADATNVEVDISTSTVSWLSAGELHTRRLESFSSGQQAFAYARARVGMIDADARPAQNHLICLDEFGAFMDANRRRDLASFLQEHAAEHPEATLLLVLPLRRDFAEAAGEAVGDERKRLMELDARIRSAGFVVEEDTW